MVASSLVVSLPTVLPLFVSPLLCGFPLHLLCTGRISSPALLVVRRLLLNPCVIPPGVQALIVRAPVAFSAPVPIVHVPISTTFVVR